jgi:alkylation response protein AidB-like acyl-CoA dehydrogenase
VDFEWSGEQLEFRDAVRQFASRELTNGDGSLSWFKDAWRKCAEFGIQGLPVAESYGGAGANNLTIIAALEALGYACPDNGLIFSLNAQMWACQHPIERFGTEEQKSRYLRGLCDGSLIAAHAMSEPGSGSDAFSLTTTATPKGDVYRLNGSKTFVTNAPVADLFVVFARAPGSSGFAGLSGFLIESGTRGLSVGPPLEKMGLHTSRMAEVFLDECEVPATSMLGRKGAGMPVFAAAMERERSMILASTIGTMERGMERAVGHARERRQSASFRPFRTDWWT